SEFPLGRRQVVSFPLIIISSNHKYKIDLTLEQLDDGIVP
ncbi:9204_t:CDS:1, partial [Cetraspora pellucida]